MSSKLIKIVPKEEIVEHEDTFTRAYQNRDLVNAVTFDSKIRLPTASGDDEIGALQLRKDGNEVHAFGNLCHSGALASGTWHTLFSITDFSSDNKDFHEGFIFPDLYTNAARTATGVAIGTGMAGSGTDTLSGVMHACLVRMRVSGDVAQCQVRLIKGLTDAATVPSIAIDIRWPVARFESYSTSS